MCVPFLKPWPCSSYKKGISDFKEAYEEAHILKRDLKRYPLNLFPFDSKDEKAC
jgi:hypothetical protein